MTGCLRIPDFAAWVMRYRHAERKLAVFYRGRVVARTWGLRRLIMPGEAVERARAAHPEVRFVERDVLYEQVRWQAVLEKVYGLTPLVEPVEPGLAYFEPLEPLSPAALARDLEAQVGAGPTRSVARIAASRTHAGHFLEIAARGVETFLRATPVKMLRDLGYSVEMVDRLELFGLNRLDRVARLSHRHLVAQFGVEGESLFALLDRSREEFPITPFQPPAAVVREFCFEEEVREPAEVEPVLASLAQEAAAELEGAVCTRVMVETMGRCEDAASLVSSVVKEGTADAGLLYRTALRSLQRSWPASPVETLRLTLGSLRAAPVSQGHLFFYRPDIRTAIERVHRRYPNAILRVVPAMRSLPLDQADGLPLIPYVSAS